MSVDEAKKVTVAFSGSRFVPPPRSTNDILALLDQQRLTESEVTRRLRAQADEPTREIADPKTRADFYLRRGAAARELGRRQQAIEDLTQATSIAPSSATFYQLGRAETLSGSVSRTVEYFRQAIRLAPPDDAGTLVGAMNHLVNAYLRIGNLEAAESALRDCLRAQEKSQQQSIPPARRSYMDAIVAAAHATVYAARGQLREAEQLQRKALEAAARGGNTEATLFRESVTEQIRSDLGLYLARQGYLLEAEREVREALVTQLRFQGRNAPRTAYVLQALIGVIDAQGRHGEAETLARELLDIYQRIGAPADAFRPAVARQRLASVLTAQQRWNDALAEYDRIAANLASEPDTYARYFRLDLRRGLALLKTGRTDDAIALLREALDQSRRTVGEPHPGTAEIRGLLGVAYVATGDPVKAVSEFKAATDVLLNRSVAVDEEGTTRPTRDPRLTLILESYIGALARVKGTPLEQQFGFDAVAEAFRLADVARGQAVQRALDAASARAAAKTPELADLARREQDARKQLSALYGALSNALGMPTQHQDAKAMDRLRADIETLRRAREALSKEIEAKFPAYADLINPRPATVEQVRAQLRPGEAVLSTLVTDEQTYLWAVPQSGAVAFAVSPMGAQTLEATVAKVRKGVDATDVQVVGGIPEFDVAAAHALYRAILEPVAAGWEHASHLLIVGHGPLAQLPFGLLPRTATALGPEQPLLFVNYRATPWLIRTHAVTVLPSVTALATLRALPAGDASRKPFAGFGDPYFSEEQARAAREGRAEANAPAPASGVPARSWRVAVRNVAVPPKDAVAPSPLGRLPRLPDTAEEIRSIATAMKADLATDVFLGERANTQAVKTLDLARYRVVAFATHGLVPGDLDGTQPALALSAPEVAKVPGDGLLTMQDILALRLNADWVVLSACNTASGNGAGAEAASGLGRAFFYAGARAVLVSNWPVETTSARQLTTTLFERLTAQPGLTRAKALQQTLNALIDDGVLVDTTTKQAAFSYAHPIFWAPFVLVGDGG